MTENTVALVRRGFSIPRLGPLSPVPEISYPLGSEFAPAWAELRSTRAAFGLLVDDAVSIDPRVLTVLTRVLAANPKMAGITLAADGLAAVYGAPRPPSSRLPYAVHPITTLPSWFALLRLDAWPQTARQATPEFFLLSEAKGKRFVQTVAQHLDFDPFEWVGCLLGAKLDALSADFRSVEDRSIVPPQLRITIPGEAGKLLGPPAPSGPRFSVLIPSIRPDFLREALESVLAQTYTDFEVRVGIDGPKAIQRRRINEVLAPYIEDPRVHVRYFEHMGTGPTRRRLAEQSRGQYITTIDDDDRFPPHALERFAAALERSPEVAVLRGGTRIFGLIEAYLPPRRRYLVDGISNDLFEVTQPWVVRRDVLEALGGFEWDPDLKNAGEDSDLLLKVDREGFPILLIDAPLYDRRLSTLNQTLDCTADECLRHVYNLYRKHNPPGWTLKDVRLSGAASMVKMRSMHVRDGSEESIVCSTQFMNFQQVGSRQDVVIDLEVTSSCNAVCTFCPREHLERSHRFIALDAVQRLADGLAQERSPTVVLCGIGESTLHPELEDIVRILALAGANVAMTTNGWNLSLELVDALYAKGLRELNVSINAAVAETHEALMRLKKFEQLVAVCNEIADKKQSLWPALLFHVSFVLTADNSGEVDAFVDTWNRDGVDRIWFHPLTNRAGLISSECRPANLLGVAERFAGHPKVTVDLFPEHEGPANLCRVANGVDFISVEGEMLLCAQDYRATHRFGNIRYSTIGELHQNKVLQHLRGVTAKTCSECSFCPRTFRAGPDATYTIVQAGAI